MPARTTAGIDRNIEITSLSPYVLLNVEGRTAEIYQQTTNDATETAAVNAPGARYVSRQLRRAMLREE